MATRTLNQIMKALEPSYAGDRKLIKKKQAALPGQYKAEFAGLEAKADQANDNILAGARRRGIGFSGIPIGEQAEYQATEYMPALARLRGQQSEERMSLQAALNDIYRNQRQAAMGIREQELARAQQERQFQQQMQMERERLAAQRAASSGRGGGAAAYLGAGLGAYLGGGGGGKKPASRSPKVPASLQKLYNQVFVKGDGSMWSDRDLVSDYNATAISARYGNARDRQKIELYHSARPDLFGSSVPAFVMQNGNKLRF